MTAPSPLVTCKGVARTYGRGEAAVVAVHGATCLVHPGDRVAITGPSGSGKSTLLHLMAALERPTSGTVTWPGLVPGGAGVPPARQVGVVFQGPSLIPALDVAENTALPLVLAGMTQTQARQRAEQALALVDAADLLSKLPEELSGGQAQRVAIARVLALGPRLVLADEPTGQLDQSTGQHIIDILLHTVRQIGAALVITTHDPAVARRLPTRWTMHEGRLVTDTPPAERDTVTSPRPQETP